MQNLYSGVLRTFRTLDRTIHTMSVVQIDGSLGEGVCIYISKLIILKMMKG